MITPQNIKNSAHARPPLGAPVLVYLEEDGYWTDARLAHDGRAHSFVDHLGLDIPAEWWIPQPPLPPDVEPPEDSVVEISPSRPAQTVRITDSGAIVRAYLPLPDWGGDYYNLALGVFARLKEVLVCPKANRVVLRLHTAAESPPDVCRTATAADLPYICAAAGAEVADRCAEVLGCLVDWRSAWKEEP